MPLPASPLDRALLSLEGLSVGDAFGERFFTHPVVVDQLIAERAVPTGAWPWTDDTAMAISVIETLAHHGHIDTDDLAQRFAARYTTEPDRGYGGGAMRLMRAIARGEDWREVSAALFPGGSWGNGGAMRAAPLGAWFAGDLERAAHEAEQSALVTHAHLEGKMGAVAVAVAAAAAPSLEQGQALFDAVLPFVAESETRRGIEAAALLSPETSPQEAARALGSGGDVSAMHTVPFCLWATARHLFDYETALWTTVAGLGDRDTTCAIVGGIVVLSSSTEIPVGFLTRREALPALDLPRPPA